MAVFPQLSPVADQSRIFATRRSYYRPIRVGQTITAMPAAEESSGNEGRRYNALRTARRTVSVIQP